jgi:hypothetical protein
MQSLADAGKPTNHHRPSIQYIRAHYNMVSNACFLPLPAADSLNAVASRLGSDAGGIHTWKQLLDYKNKLRARHGEHLPQSMLSA